VEIHRDLGHAGNTGGKKCQEKSDAPVRQQQTGDTPENGKQSTLGEQLPDELARTYA